MVKLIIISCPSLAGERLPLQISSLSGALSSGCIESLEIITSDDDSFVGSFPYNNDMWFYDLACSWNLFFRNAHAAMSTVSSETSLVPNSLLLRKFFAKRALSASEHSVAQRHYRALRMISKGSQPTIVLEDDALLTHTDGLLTSCRLISDRGSQLGFVDLSDDYMDYHEKSAHRLEEFNGLHLLHRRIAETRTLMAYALTPDIANTILEKMTYYSLPIDMQIQTILALEGVKGVTIKPSPFRHGSKDGTMKSSISM